MSKVPSFLQQFSVVVITGGSSGIGEAFLTAIGQYRPEISFFNLSRSTPSIKLKNLQHIPCDLSEPASLKAAAATILDALPQTDPGKILLINNSGYGVYGLSDQMDTDALLGMVDLNIRAMVDLTQRMIPALIARGGTVINVGSLAGYVPTPTIAVYGATKSFVLQWSLSLRAELGDHGIAVMALCPGPTSTQFFRRAGFDQGAMPHGTGTTADHVVRAALCAAAKNRSIETPGWTNKIMRVLSMFLPLEWKVPITYQVLKRVRLDVLKRKQAPCKK